jgi:hypothetical protein
VAVAAHRIATLVIAQDPGEVRAAQLVVLAVSSRLQAAKIESYGRLSDFVFKVLLREALKSHRTDVAFGIVAVENQKSLTMCERNGLVSQTQINARYARVTGRFMTRRGRGLTPPAAELP